MTSVERQCVASRPPTPLAASIRIIETLEGLDSLASVWEMLAARADIPMQHFPWARAVAASYAAGHKLHVVAVGMPEPVAILPLVRRPDRFRRLELLGVRELGEPLDALCADSSAATLLADALISLGFPLFLERIPADSPLVAALESAGRHRCILRSRSARGYPWLALDQSWVQPEQHLNSGRRSDLRRARRFAEQKGPVCCEILSPTPDELEPLVRTALRVEAAGWKGQQGSDLISNAIMGSFYRQYMEAACQKGILRLCFLRIGKRVAAMQIAVECGQSLWLLKIGYYSEFARSSPGILLLAETIRYAAKRGLRSYEFLGFSEPWLQTWTQLVRPCIALWFYPAGIGGGAALAVDAIRLARKKFHSIIGSRWRRGPIPGTGP